MTAPPPARPRARLVPPPVSRDPALDRRLSRRGPFTFAVSLHGKPTVDVDADAGDAVRLAVAILTHYDADLPDDLRCPGTTGRPSSGGG